MSLRKLKDQELLGQIKSLVQQERKLLTQVLEHLREVEYRRLYSDLGYDSLFSYCVKELGYSDGAAGRRIQAMHLIKELPSVEKKIEEGRLNLSNLCQAQSYFREAKRLEPAKTVTSTEKLELLEKLENKSAREGQTVLLSLSPERALPKERLRPVTTDISEASFLIGPILKAQLDELRSLLGPKGANLNMTELITKMASLSLQQVREKKFGKKRALGFRMAQGQRTRPKAPQSPQTSNSPAGEISFKPQKSECQPILSKTQVSMNSQRLRNLQSKLALKRTNKPASTATTPAPEPASRYVAKSVKHEVWVRDKGSCTKCGSRRNLQFDHIKPFALGGTSESKNLRLLCFHCNQRLAINTYGLAKMDQHYRTL